MDNPAIEIFLIKNILLLLQIDMRHMASSTGRCDKCKLNKENIYIYIYIYIYLKEVWTKEIQ